MVKAIDDRDGVVAVTCDHQSGSVFQAGETWVHCTAYDSSGNMGEGVFRVIIEIKELTITQWLKDVVSFWINDEINDDCFVQVIQYLVEHEIIIVPNTTPTGEQTTQIPSWIKTNTEFWVNNQISDAEFATGIEWLINNGIISV